MALPIISADQRLSEKRCAKVALVGVPGAGKTSQIRTLNAASTLLVDTEAGDLSILDWAGDTLRPRTWPEFKDLVVFLAGPSPSASPEQAFSQAHFDHVCQRYGDPAQLAKYDTYFVDSLTVLSRMCLAWCKTQPAAFSEKTGKPDTRGAYGLLGTEMIGALTHLQHVRDKHVIYVCILEEKLDDFNRRVYQLQLEGAKTSAELPGVLDEVITLASITGAMHDAGQQFSQDFARAFGSGVASPKLDGLPGGTAPGQMMVEKNAGAARAVRDALEAVGGSGSPAGSALWYVAGLQMSIRDWSMRDGWNGKRVEKNEAKGILLAALGMLARYYGYERSGPRPPRTTYRSVVLP